MRFIKFDIFNRSDAFSTLILNHTYNSMEELSTSSTSDIFGIIGNNVYVLYNDSWEQMLKYSPSAKKLAVTTTIFVELVQTLEEKYNVTSLTDFNGTEGQVVFNNKRIFVWHGSTWVKVAQYSIVESPPEPPTPTPEDDSFVTRKQVIIIINDMWPDLIAPVLVRIEKLEETVSLHNTYINRLESNVKKIMLDITELFRRMEVVEGTTADHENRIGSIETLTQEHSTSIDRLKVLVDSLSTEIDGINEALKNKADLVNGVVPASQLPSYVDDVLEYETETDFPETGESGKVYVELSTNKTYRWSGSTYVVIGSDLALGETATTAFPGDRGKTLETQLVTVKNDVISVKADLGALSNTVASHGTDIRDLNTVLTTTNTTVTNLSLKVDGIVADMTDLEARVSSIEDDINASLVKVESILGVMTNTEEIPDPVNP